MNPLPSGTVTFLLTDVEQSTRLWLHSDPQMRAALARHDQIAQTCIAEAGGILVKARGEGDSLFTVFASAPDAVRAALALQQTLCAENWNLPAPLRVRMALHTGEVESRDGDYYGLTITLGTRIRNVGHGGQILLSQATADLARNALPENATLLDLGLHGLKDLQSPERLWQLRHPDLPADFPPLRSLAAYKHNLPRQLTSFIGREEELEEIKRLLTQTSLLTMIGSGGCGKTRLALQAAADLLDDYPDGIWFVELAPLSDPALIVRAIAKTLGLREEPGADALEALCEALRTQKVLLILDNCEHLADGAAQIVKKLLQSCPTLRILTTSRVRLNVPGEIPWRVPSLLIPDDKTFSSVDAALRNAALRLFVERATAAHSQFAMTDANLPAVAQICRRLDGIPLAIELAAARVNSLTAQQVAKRLDKRFKLLIGGSATVLERHQTLQALIDWSHELLSVEQRVLLRRLAVFAGGWTLEAAEAVCAWGEIEAEDVVDVLSHLVDASLVIAEEQDEAHRYRLLETVRQYAQERLEEAEEDAQARERHLQYFLELAEEAEPQLIEATQVEWLQRLENEHDNLRAALTWAVGDDKRLRLASALWRFWQLRYITEGRGWLAGALANARGASSQLRAKALNGLGILMARQGEYETGAQLLQESLTIRQQADDEWGTAETLNSLGCLASDQGDYTDAQNLHEQSLAIRRRIGDKWGEAASLNNLGMTMGSMDDYSQAKSYYEISLDMYRQMQDTMRLAGVSANLGMIALNQQEYEYAISLFEQSISIFRAANSKWHLAITCYNMGDGLLGVRKSEAASAFFADSLRLCHELGDRNGVAFALIGLAKTAASKNNDFLAAQLFSATAHLRQMYHILLPDSYQKPVDHKIAVLRVRMSDQDFMRAWQSGQTMSYEEVIALSAAI